MAVNNPTHCGSGTPFGLMMMMMMMMVLTVDSRCIYEVLGIRHRMEVDEDEDEDKEKVPINTV